MLAHYTPVESFYKLAKVVEDDPEFDTKKASKGKSAARLTPH